MTLFSLGIFIQD
uniref:Uncharacterized protein n=1 Tax=Anguilla anguilla TaxID=7936 RepID=A0A0E9VQQ5_ANGAN